MEDQKVANIWKKRVLKAYDRICTIKEEENVEFWIRNIFDTDVPETEIEKWHPVSKFQPSENNAKSAKVTRYVGDGQKIGGSQTVFASSMNEVESIPRMYAWTPINVNIISEEEELNNIPYLGENDTESNEVFIDNLLDNYNGKVHEIKDTTFMDSRLYVDLVKKLNDIYIKEMNLNVDVINKENQPFPNDLIFEAIHSVFPKSGTPTELADMYAKITGFDNTTSKPIPNIDGAKATSNSRKVTMSSYHQLFCTRCFKYDCKEHQDQPPINMSKRPFPELEPFTKPCGENCYKHFLNSAQRNILNADEPSTSKNANVNMATKKANNSEWTGGDESLFRTLIHVFPKNLCVIAEMMNTKTCQEVYEFSQKEKPDVNLQKLREGCKPPINSRQIERTKTVQRRKLYQSNKTPYYKPCSHEGKCGEDCPCIELKISCEKFCNCKSDCHNRFPGCRCKAKCIIKVCPCYISSRECDPDLCIGCKAGAFDIKDMTCKNVNLQRKLNKKLRFDKSACTGWGAFIEEAAKKNEFISEYCGEILKDDDAERRGLLYDKQQRSFLFRLNDSFSVDSTRAGNTIRFANHSKKPNCYIKVLKVAGDHRIGIFASRDLNPGEELFFDYGYNDDQLKFVPIEYNP